MAFQRLYIALAIGVAMALTSVASAAHEGQLTLEVYNAGEDSFNVNAVLVSGKHDAILLDTGFTRADALRIVAMVLDSHKTLKTIYISQSDPDYYFGIDLVKQYFPEAKVVSTAQTLKAIKKTLAAKMAYWPQRMGVNAPARIELPEALSANRLTLEGETLDILGLDDQLAHRSYLWIPSRRTVVGGANVFSGVHVWTADTPSSADRAAWIKKLDAMHALAARRVVAGHSVAGLPEDGSQILYTRDYLKRFEIQNAKAANAASLIKAMKEAYPSAGQAMALEIGAKVAKGEMSWPVP